jgi:predicted RNase H-like HicB family nuclease
MQRVVRVYLEIAPGSDGGAAAHAPTLAGLVGFGWDERRALRDLDRAADLYHAVLRRQGLASGPPGEHLFWRPARRVPGQPFWLSGHATALLPPDRVPPSDRRIRRVMRIVRALQAEHLGRLDRAPRQWGRSTSRHRTPEQTLVHMGDCAWWYCSRVDDRLPEPGRECPDEPRARLAHLLDFAERWLLDLVPRARGRVVVPRRFPSSDPNERWTAGKVLRRLAEHQFEHLRTARGWRPMCD